MICSRFGIARWKEPCTLLIGGKICGKRAEGIEMVDSREMACCRQAWKEWQTGYHPIVAEDIKMMEAEGGKYFNLVQLIAKVI